MDSLLAGDPGNRRDVDDRAAARSLHQRDREFHAQENATRIDRHQQVPGRGVEQILDPTAAEASIIDEDIELAELGEGRVDRRLPFRLAGHVEMAEYGGPVALPVC